MNRLGRALCSGILALAAVAAADTPAAPAAATASADVQLLPWRRAVDTTALAAGAWAEIWDDSVLAAGTQAEFADIRLADAAGVAQAFTRRDPALHDVWYVPLDQEYTTVAGRDVVRLDLGGRAAIALAVRIRSNAYGTHYVVEASSDSVQWREIAFPGTGPRTDPGHETFDIGVVTDRWLRVQVPQPRPLTERRMAPRPDAPVVPPTLPQASPGEAPLQFLERRMRDTPREAVPFRVVASRFEARTWIAEIEIDAPPMALCRAVLTPRTALARHAVRVEGRLPTGGWRDLVHGVVESIPDSAGTRRAGAIEWDPMRTTALRLRVEGADAPDAPVAIDSIVRTPVRFAFPRPDGARWLAYGDAHVLAAHAPLDLERMAATTFVRVGLGAPEPNPSYRAPRFGLVWLQRHPAALAVALLAVLALVALLVLRPPVARR